MHHEVGPLEFSEAVQRQLVRCHLLEGTEPSQTLPLDEVRALEETYGCALPDDMLAVMASGTKLFGEEYEMRLDRVAAHTARVAETDGPEGYLGIGSHPTKLALFLIEQDWTLPLFLFEYDTSARSIVPHGIESWLEYIIGQYAETLLLAGGEEELARAGRVPTPEEVEAFEPRLV